MENFASLTAERILRTGATEGQVEAIIRPKALQLASIIKMTDDKQWALTVLGVVLQEHPNNIKLALDLTEEGIKEYPTRRSAEQIPDVNIKQAAYRIAVEMGSGGCRHDQYWVPNPNITEPEPGIKPGGYCKHPPGFKAMEGKVTYDKPKKQERRKKKKKPIEEEILDEDFDFGEEEEDLEAVEPEEEAAQPEYEEEEEVLPYKAQPFTTLSDDGKKEHKKYLKHIERIYNLTNLPGAFAEVMMKEAGIDPKTAKVLKFILNTSDFGFSALGTATGQLWMVPIPIGSLLIGTLVATAKDIKAPVKVAKMVFNVLKERRRRRKETKKTASIDLFRICRLAIYSDKQHTDSMPFATHGHWVASGRPSDFLEAYLSWRVAKGDMGMADYFVLQTRGHIPPMMAPFYLLVLQLEDDLFQPVNMARQEKEGYSTVLREMFLKKFPKANRKHFLTGMEPKGPTNWTPDY